MLIASNELSRLVRQPIIIVIVCILLSLTAINGVTNADTLRGDNSDRLFLEGVSNMFFFNSIYIAVISMFIGVLSIVEDRSSGSLRSLMTKPVYRRDVLTGKFVGTLTLIVLIATCCVLFGVAMILVFSGGPASPMDIFLRVGTYIPLLFLNCALMLAITMAVGIVVKDVFGTLICVGSLFFFDWLVNIPDSVSKMLGDLVYLNQRVLYATAFFPSKASLFDSSSSYSDWLDSALPFILAMVIALIVFLSLTFFIFCREDD